jgi:hypothetical protein
MATVMKVSFDLSRSRRANTRLKSNLGVTAGQAADRRPRRVIKEP